MHDKFSTELLPANIGITIEDRFLVIRPITGEEITHKYLEWLNDRQINQFLEVRQQQQTFQSVLDYINGLRANQNEAFAIFMKTKMRHIGTSGVVIDKSAGVLTYGLLIGDVEAQRIGLGAMASILLVDFFFRQKYVNKIAAGAIADNFRSWRLLEDLGFQKEGVRRKHTRLLSGELSDIYLYGLLREEWENTRSKFAKLLDDVIITDSFIKV